MTRRSHGHGRSSNVAWACTYCVGGRERHVGYRRLGSLSGPLRQGSAQRGRTRVARRVCGRCWRVSKTSNVRERAAWQWGGRKGPRSLLVLSEWAPHRWLSRKPSARPILRLPARPLCCTARCLRRRPLRRRVVAYILAAVPRVGAAGTVRHRCASCLSAPRWRFARRAR